MTSTNTIAPSPQPDDPTSASYIPRAASPALRLQSAALPTVEFARVGAGTPATELQGFPVKM